MPNRNGDRGDTRVARDGTLDLNARTAKDYSGVISSAYGARNDARQNDINGGNRVSEMGVIMGLLTQGMGGREDGSSAREVLQVLLMATPLYNDMLRQQEWLRGRGRVH